MDDLISRQAAIDKIESLKRERVNPLTEKEKAMNYILEVAASCIYYLPSAKSDLQQTCNKLATDCISRQAAIDALARTARDAFNLSDEYNNYLAGLMDGENAIRGLPSAQQERKTGKWIWDDEGYHCSECFFHAYGNTLECINGTYKYCPNCGAKMEVEHG